MDIYVIYLMVWGLGLIACYWVAFVQGYGPKAKRGKRS